MQKILSTVNCSFAYNNGQFQLDGVSLDIYPGRLFGIVGPNGSGKSTLLRIMTGILNPDEGGVSLYGEEVKSYHRRQFAQEVAFLPQNPSPSFDLTVREVVGLGRYPYKKGLGLLDKTDELVIDRTLEDTECTPLAGRYFSTLSGGERQRVLVASVLAQEPSLLLLDEPGASLDIHHKSHVFDLLWALSRRGIGVVVVTHDLNLAAEFCDELILLSDGKVVETGKPEEVMTGSLLSQIYDAELQVIKHPLTQSPMVNVMGKKINEGNG